MEATHAGGGGLETTRAEASNAEATNNYTGSSCNCVV